MGVPPHIIIIFVIKLFHPWQVIDNNNKNKVNIYNAAPNNNRLYRVKYSAQSAEGKNKIVLVTKVSELIFYCKQLK